MEATELRIGNYIYYGFENRVWQVSPISISGIENNTVKSEPIPLTEEWLVNFGFTKTGHYYWDVLYFELTELGNGKYINSVNGHEYDHGIEIQYVHQLQNLYFALTGEELKTNNL